MLVRGAGCRGDWNLCCCLEGAAQGTGASVDDAPTMPRLLARAVKSAAVRVLMMSVSDLSALQIACVAMLGEIFKLSWGFGGPAWWSPWVLVAQCFDMLHNLGHTLSRDIKTVEHKTEHAMVKLRHGDSGRRRSQSASCTYWT